MPLDSVPAAIRDIAAGRLVIVADDEDRENEGDLVCAAEKITPELVNFMTKFGRGLICVSMTAERADALELPLMTERSTDPQGTAFTVSVDAHHRFGVTTGNLRARPGQDRTGAGRPGIDPRRPQAARGISSPCGPAEGGCCAAWARPKPPSTSPASPDWRPPASSARSSTRTGRWPAGTNSRSWPGNTTSGSSRSSSWWRIGLARERLVRRVVETRLRTAWGEFLFIGYRSDIDDSGPHRAGQREGRGKGGRAGPHACREPPGRDLRVA